jgi:hypothetical protein
VRALLWLARWIDAHVFGAWQCERCGCTDHFACWNGCSWSLNQYIDGRTLCTRCERWDVLMPDVIA